LAEARSQVLKAMAHPSRIFIMTRLSEKPATVGELTKEIGADISTVSKHLSVLKSSGLIEGKKENASVRYFLRCPCILEFIHCIDDVIIEEAERGLSCIRRTPI